MTDVEIEDAEIGKVYDVYVHDCCMGVGFRATLEARLGPEVEPDVLAGDEAGGWPTYRTYWSNGVVLDCHDGAGFMEVET